MMVSLEVPFTREITVARANPTPDSTEKTVEEGRAGVCRQLRSSAKDR